MCVSPTVLLYVEPSLLTFVYLIYNGKYVSDKSAVLIHLESQLVREAPFFDLRAISGLDRSWMWF